VISHLQNCHFFNVSTNHFLSLAEYKNAAKASTWLYRIALNTAINYKRKNDKAVTASRSDFLNEFEVNASPAFDDEYKLMHQFIAGLPSLEKALVMLYLDEYSYKEIAEIMGLSQTNVGTKLMRFKEKLKVRRTNLLILKNQRMDLDELKTTWKQYDNDLKKYRLLNEDALRSSVAGNVQKSASDARSAEYFRIAFCGLLILFFSLLMYKVNNNPPIVLSFAVVLIANILSMGMSIYKLSYLPLTYFDNNAVAASAQQIQRFNIMIRRERVFAVLFSPLLVTSLFMLLFLGLTIKTL